MAVLNEPEMGDEVFKEDRQAEKSLQVSSSWEAGEAGLSSSLNSLAFSTCRLLVYLLADDPTQLACQFDSCRARLSSRGTWPEKKDQKCPPKLSSKHLVSVLHTFPIRSDFKNKNQNQEIQSINKSLT